MITTFNKRLKTTYRFKKKKKCSHDFSCSKKKEPTLPHVMLSLLYPDPLPFSVHPQEGSLHTRLCTVVRIAEAGTSGMVTSSNTAVRLPSADPRGSCWPSSHASHDKSQHGDFCKSIAERTWMLSNPIQAKGQICKWCCPPGISNTKLYHFEPLQPPDKDPTAFKQCQFKPTQTLTTLKRRTKRDLSHAGCFYWMDKGSTQSVTEY